MLICSGIVLFCLIDNYTADKESEWADEKDGHLIISGTIAAHGHSGSPHASQPWIYMFLGWVILAVYIFLAKLTKNEKKSTEERTTPANYTLLITGIPTKLIKDEKKLKKELKQWLRLRDPDSFMGCYSNDGSGNSGRVSFELKADMTWTCEQ